MISRVLILSLFSLFIFSTSSAYAATLTLSGTGQVWSVQDLTMTPPFLSEMPKVGQTVTFSITYDGDPLSFGPDLNPGSAMVGIYEYLGASSYQVDFGALGSFSSTSSTLIIGSAASDDPNRELWSLDSNDTSEGWKADTFFFESTINLIVNDSLRTSFENMAVWQADQDKWGNNNDEIALLKDREVLYIWITSAQFQQGIPNKPPTANAGIDQSGHAGDLGYLNGGESFDDKIGCHILICD